MKGVYVVIQWNTDHVHTRCACKSKSQATNIMNELQTSTFKSSSDNWAVRWCEVIE